MQHAPTPLRRSTMCRDEVSPSGLVSAQVEWHCALNATRLALLKHTMAYCRSVHGSLQVREQRNGQGREKCWRGGKKKCGAVR